jgi:AhpD family alkylhydroperoxidase
MKTTLGVALVMLALPGMAAPRSAEAQAALNDIEKTFGFTPAFLRALPDAVLPGAWKEMKDLEMSTDSALPAKTKELIGLAVASQIPCRYCVAAHTDFAKGNGATMDDLGIAVAQAGLTRHWSAFINGAPIDDAAFRTDLNKMISALKQAGPNERTAKGEPITDAESAYKDIQARIGFVPNFFKSFPRQGIAGAWMQYRDIQLSPHDMPARYINLIGLAVGSQIPCRYCIDENTELARARGATDEEINEAVAMAAHTRNFSTLLNGLQIDEAQFKADLRRLAQHKPKTAAR